MIERGARLMCEASEKLAHGERPERCADDLVRGKPWRMQVALLAAMCDAARAMGRTKMWSGRNVQRKRSGWQRKLDVEQVRAMRAMAKRTTITEVAKHFDVPRSTAHAVVTRRTWRDVA